MKSYDEICKVVEDCRFNDWRFKVVNQPSKMYLQVVAPGDTCNVTGNTMPWQGRKWFISIHMTTTELVQTAFKAVQTAMEHELREQFTYKQAMIFGPHWDVDHLADSLNAKPSLGEDARATIVDLSA